MRCPRCGSEMEQVDYYHKECPRCRYSTSFNMPDVKFDPEPDDMWDY